MSSFFDDCFVLGKIRVPKRLLVPLVIVFAAKVVGAIFIFYSMNIQNTGTFWSDSGRVYSWEQNDVLLANPEQYRDGL